MTFPPMKCERCSGEGVIEYDQSHGDYDEAVCTECPECNGTGIEPDDDDTDPDEGN